MPHNETSAPTGTVEPKHQPARSHPDLIRFHTGSGFSNYITSLVALPSGALFARLEPNVNTPAPCATYQTVQTGRDSHIQLNSDLVYMNHSCEPSLVIDVKALEVRVVNDRDLRVGDALTFFYPSTEWDSAQPFQCECGSRECLGEMRGAKGLSRDVLEKYWINEHIMEMVREENSAK